MEDYQQLVKVKLLCAVMDLPAKAALLNCTQYNGAFGCSTCKHPGSMVFNDIECVHFLILLIVSLGVSWKRESTCIQI